MTTKRYVTHTRRETVVYFEPRKKQAQAQPKPQAKPKPQPQPKRPKVPAQFSISLNHAGAPLWRVQGALPEELALYVLDLVTEHNEDC